MTKLKEEYDDGFPNNFDAKKHKFHGNYCSTKQEGQKDEYEIKGLRTVENKTKPIFDCIGQLVMDYNEGIDNMSSGTGTVINKLPNYHYMVLTCGHNLVKYDRITKKQDKPQNIWFLPKGCGEYKCRLQFVDEMIYHRYKPEKELCEHDLALVLFYDRKGIDGLAAHHYDVVEVDEVVYITEWKDKTDSELNIYGYPSKSEGLLQGAAGDAELQRDRGLWTYNDIATYPGQSGSAIFKRIEKNQYGLYGIHTYGDTVKQENCGIFLDTEKMEWIKQTINKFEAIAKANAPFKEVTDKVSEPPRAPERKQDDDFQNPQYSKLYKILTEWGLSQYVDIMKEEGWDDPNLWSCIDDYTLQNILHFKSGHIAKFKQNLNQQSTKKKPIVAKLVLLGDTMVGKSSIVLRFVTNKFYDSLFSTIGASFLVQTMMVESQEMKLEIWDTAGQERYASMAALYYRGSSGALLVYDITNRESYENCKQWIEQLRTIEGDHVVIGLAGNKVDLSEQRQVTEDEARQYAKANGLILYETSAKTAHNIRVIFSVVAQEILKRKDVRKVPKDVIALEPEDEPKKNKSCCELL